MFGPFQYNWSYEVWDDDVRFVLNDTIMIDVLGGTAAWRSEDREANIKLCERERPHIEAACQKARSRLPVAGEIALTKGDFVRIMGAPSSAADTIEDVRLVLTFADSKTAQAVWRVGIFGGLP